MVNPTGLRDECRRGICAGSNRGGKSLEQFDAARRTGNPHAPGLSLL
jgi:hypothetical protein